jgi:hypothetical protein
MSLKVPVSGRLWGSVWDESIELKGRTWKLSLQRGFGTETTLLNDDSNSSYGRCMLREGGHVIKCWPAHEGFLEEAEFYEKNLIGRDRY